MKQDIKPLTGLRGVAAFIVMLYHLPLNPAFAGDRLAIFHSGYLCVDLFYVLSGFLLSLRYREAFMHGLKSNPLAVFWLHRFSRIYPLYFVASGIYYLKWLFNFNNQRTIDFSSYDIVANLFLIQGWGVNAQPICWPTWSVSTEMFAYILFPVIILLMANKSGIRSFLLLALSIAGIYCVARSPYGTNGAMDVVDANNFFPLLRCVSEFCLGVLAFEVARCRLGQKLIASAWTLPVVLVTLIGFFDMGASDVAVVLLLPILVMSLSGTSQVGMLIFGNRLVHWLGVISYSLYLFHMLFRDMAGYIMGLLVKHFGVMPPLPFVLLAIAGSLAGAAFFQVFVEQRGQGFIRRYANKIFNSDLPPRRSL